MSARVSARCSPSPRSQFKSSFIRGPESDALSGLALNKPRNVRRVEHSEFGIAANGRAVAQGHDRQSALRHLHCADAHRFAEELRQTRFERRALQAVADAITLRTQRPGLGEKAIAVGL